MLGSLLSSVVKIVNTPIRVAENMVDIDDEDRILSKPLDSLADELKNADS